ncbi:MAG: hypothetical protein ACRERC_09220 [Candidatus Binatia bacterium]
MNSTLRFIASLVVGCVTAVAIATAGFSVLRTLWPEYAAAEPEKAYTLVMLFSRLAVGALCTAGAACATTVIAGDNGRAAWWLGGLFVVISLPSHLYYVWADYPAWYHFVYLSSLAPIAGLTGRVVGTAGRPHSLRSPRPTRDGER